MYHLYGPNIVKGANNKDWDVFSQDFRVEYKSSKKYREDVQSQWEEVEVLSNLSTDFELIGIIRGESKIIVLWRHTSSVMKGEILGRQNLRVEDGQLKVSGVWID